MWSANTGRSNTQLVHTICLGAHSRTSCNILVFAAHSMSKGVDVVLREGKKKKVIDAFTRLSLTIPGMRIAYYIFRHGTVKRFAPLKKISRSDLHGQKKKTEHSLIILMLFLSFIDI